MVPRNDSLFSFLVPFGAIQLQQEIGRGAFGVVYRAIYNNIDIACKMLSEEVRSEMDETEFLQEARTMSQIPRHHNVVALVGICRGDKVCILSGK
jgi:serine/threonine protein kinase